MTPQAPTQTAHPETSAGVWTWTAASPPVPPVPTPSQPTPPQGLSPKVAIASVGLMVLLSAGVGWRVYEAGMTAGASGAQAELAHLKTQAATTNARIDNFCNGGVQ